MSEASGRSLLSSSLLMAGAAYLSYAAGLLGSILVARTLGPHDFGVYAYIIWLAGVSVSIVNHGLPVSAIKFISESMGAGRDVLAGSFHVWLRHAHRWSMAILGTAIFLFLWAKHPADWTGKFYLYAPAVLLAAYAKASYLFNTSVSKGHRIFTVEAKTVAFLSLCNVVALLLAWVVGISLDGMLLVYVLISVGYWFSTVHMMRREPIHVSQEKLPQDAKDRLISHLGWTVVLTGIGVFNEGAVNIYALNEFVGSAEVGYYTIAAGLTKAGMDLLTVGLSSVLMSAMSHASGRDGSAGLAKVFHSAVKNFHFFGLLLVGLGCLSADWVVQLLYGARYLPAVDIMKVMFILGGVTLSEGVFASLLSVLDKQRDRVLINAVSLLVTVPVSFLLIRSLGLSGAIWAYAINRFVVFAVAVISTTNMTAIHAPWLQLARLTGAMLLALVLPMALAHLVPGLVMGVLACVVFTLAFIALASRWRVWDRDELEAVTSLAQRVPGASAVLAWVLPRQDRSKDA